MKNFIKIVYIALTIIIISLPVFSKENKPKVGLVLSGGGAKGLAHIGVIKVLEELGIQIDFISGTSMGSTVAALYAIGYDGKELEEIAKELDWLSYLNNEIPRQDMNIIIKELYSKYAFIFEFDSKGMYLPQSLVNGHKLDLLLSRLTYRVHDENDFSKFKIPFICAATNIVTGKAVILKKGYIVDALRASMAIPSILAPVEINGNLLVDGGLSKNLPASDLKKMGADIIIGIDVGQPLYKKNQLNSLDKIMEQSVSFLGEKVNNEERKFCDILIKPELKNYSSASFDSADELIALGEKAARNQYDILKKLSIKLNKFSRKSITYKFKDINDKVKINKIIIRGTNKTSEAMIKEIAGIKEGSYGDIKDFEYIVRKIYGTNLYETVYYRLEKNNKDSNLIIIVKEKPRNSFKFGFNYDSDMNSSLMFNLDFSNIFLENSKLLISTRLGDNPKWDLAYFFHTGLNPGFSFGTGINVSKYDVYAYDQDQRIASYEFYNYNTFAMAAIDIGNWGLLFGGIEKELARYDPEIALPGTESYKNDFWNYLVSLKIDLLDDRYYPKKWLYLYAEAKSVHDSYAVHSEYNYKNFERYIFSYLVALPVLKRLTIQAGGHTFITTTNDLPPAYMFYMGGYQQVEDWIFPLVGYDFMEITGANGRIHFANLQIEFIKNFFFILKWNCGKASESYKDLNNNEDFLYGSGATLGTKTSFGPVEISLLKNHQKDEYNIHFNVGMFF